MGNMTRKNAVSITVVIMILMTSWYSMLIPQKPFDTHLLSSQVKATSENDPYKRFIGQTIEKGKKNEAEIIAKGKVEQNRSNDDSNANLSRGGLSLNENTYMGIFKLTAYTLSESECGKSSSSPSFGIASSGYNFKNKDLRCRKVAVDPKRIPIGSTIYIEFPKDYNTTTLPDGTSFELSGLYQAVDIGGAIKGDRLDLFVGGLGKKFQQFSFKIGIRNVRVYI